MSAQKMDVLAVLDHDRRPQTHRRAACRVRVVSPEASACAGDAGRSRTPCRLRALVMGWL
jgi:hypothetical protein